MLDVAAINTRFGLKDQLSFKEVSSGFVMANIDNKFATATIALQGAQVATWAPKGEKPVIWLSKAAKFAPGKSIRGGVPICWPWFGAHATEAKFPGHGYARTVPWEIIETESLRDGRTRLAFRLVESDATRAQWPHNTPVECHVTVGQNLEIELVTRNNTSSTVTITEALHTYFEVGDITKVKISGLDATEYLDKVEDFKRKKQQGAITISSEVDRVYVNTSADCVIDDPVLKRRIRIQKRDAKSTVVWNPWIEKAEKMGDLGNNGYMHMVCVESGNAAENTVQIKPNAEHRMWVSYSVEH